MRLRLRPPGARAAILAVALAGICGRARAAEPWTPAGPPGGAVYSLAIDPKQPSNLYVGAFGGGVWKSTDSGASWKRLDGVPPQQSVNAVAVDPSRPQTVLAGTYDAGIWRSADGGGSWKRVQNLGDRQPEILAIVFDPAQPRIAYASTDSTGFPNGVFKSEDAGATWNHASEGLPKDPRVFALAVNPKAPGVLYAGTSQGVYLSKDSAKGWSGLGGPLSDEFVQSVAADGTAVVAGATSEGIFWSGDSGSTWEKAESDLDLAGDRIYALAADPEQAGTFYAGVPNHILRSTNGGKRWRGVTKGFNWINFRSLLMPATGGNTFFAGTGRDGVLKTNDLGKTWLPSTGFYAFDVTSVLADPETPGRIFAGTTQGGVHLSEDGGKTWSLANEGLEDRSVLSLAFDPKNPRAILAGTREGIYRSADGGGKWSQVTRSISFEVQQVVFALSDANRVYARDENTIWRSDDAGATWKEMRPALEIQGTTLGAFGLAAAPSSPDIVLANTYRKVFRSTDGAKTWTVVSGIPATTRVNRIAADPAGTMWAATEEGVYRSPDGAAWSIAGRGTEGTDVQTLLVDPAVPGTVYAGAWKKGILRTTDGGKTWTRLGGDPPHPDAVALAIEKGPPRALLVGFGGGSVWRLDIDSAAKATTSQPPSRRKK